MNEHESPEEVSLRSNEPLAVELTAAVQRGDAERLRRLLDKRPELARVRIIAQGDTFPSRTLLHLFADWPGHRRNPQGIVAVLQAAGADLDASGDPTKVAEAPLHWAASNDDVELVDALLDAGADINVPGCIINGLGPVADAAVFGGIQAGRRLVERGAVTNIFQAAALGFIDLVRGELSAEPAPDVERVTAAFWAACGSGNRDIAELLLGHGADINWLGWGDNTALDQARDADADDLAAWLESRGAKSAADLRGGSQEQVTPDGDEQAASVAFHLRPAKEDAPAGFAPCFPTRDLHAALAHYRQLGFTVMDYTAGASWGWARFENAEIHLYVKEDHDPARTAAAADLTVVDCDALERQWSATGVPGTSDPYDTPYRRREAAHVDLDHNLIRFGSPTPDP
ncbi:MAG: hypothetical protein ACRDVP_05410 [Acidimicrobiales bacterium]